MSLSNKIKRLNLIARRQPLTFPGFIAQRLGSHIQSQITRRGQGYLSHYGAWHGNAGDVMIVYAQHRLFDHLLGKQGWVDENHKKKVLAEDVARINADAKAVVVGGGGILLPDRHRKIPNTDSDWLWNISLENLRALKKPIIGFAIGYNRMKGQDDFRPYFKEHIAETVDRSVFFGMRNSSSIEKLTPYLPSRLIDKLSLQPCPTNLMSITEPERWAAKRDPKKKSVVFVLFMGFKTLGLIEKQENIRRVARLAKRLVQRDWEIHIATHTIDELDALPAFELEKVPFKHTMLDMLSREAVVQYYRDKSLVIGMRGHGVMLPYGIGVPVMGIINHYKVRYFLEEVKLGDQTVDLEDPHMESKVDELVKHFENDRDAFHRRIDTEKPRLWQQTLKNFESLKSYLR